MLKRHRPHVKEIQPSGGASQGKIRKSLLSAAPDCIMRVATGAEVLWTAFLVLLHEESAMRPFAVRALLPVFLVLVPLGGCGGSSSPSDGGGGGGNGSEPVETTSVTVRDTGFDPSAIRVAPGATVTWTFSGSEEHNVTFSNQAIQSSGNQSSGQHAALMPEATGTYPYSCTLHAGMNGSVQVQ